MKQIHGTVGIVRVLVLVGAFSLILNSQSKATPLGFTMESSPDIATWNVLVQYTANTSLFTASGSPYDYLPPGGTSGENDVYIWNASEDNLGGVYSLSATIDNSGALVSGTITIQGAIPDLYLPYGDLLTGTLTAFGYQDAGGDPFEFMFTIGGGALASDYGGVGSSAAMQMSMQDGNFTGSFLTDFGNGGGDPPPGLCDTGVIIPEPSSFLLLLMGGVLCAAMHHRRDKRAGAADPAI